MPERETNARVGASQLLVTQKTPSLTQKEKPWRRISGHHNKCKEFREIERNREKWRERKELFKHKKKDRETKREGRS